MFYVHKYEVQQMYGGPEEGGWWYDSGEPVLSNMASFLIEENAHELCRHLNGKEHERRKSEESYGYTSVLSAQSTHYSYQVSKSPVAVAYPEERPHYA